MLMLFRKIVPIGVSLLVLLMVVLPASAATFNVDVNDPGCNDTTGAPYCSIQAAIDAAALNAVTDTIIVAPGTYAESLVIDEPNLTIQGPKVGQAGNAPGRGVGEAILIPPAPNSGASFPASVMVLLDDDAEGFTIDGMTLDGDNPAFSPPTSGSVDIGLGASVEADYGIINNAASEGIDNAVMQNNRFLNIPFAVYFYDGFSGGQGNHTGALLTNNYFYNIRSDGDFARAVLMIDNAYINTTNNIMDEVEYGIQLNNLARDNGSVGTVILDGNTITNADILGIYLNLVYQFAPDFIVSNNTITVGNPPPLSPTLEEERDAGIIIYSWSTGPTATLQDNNVTGFYNGYRVWNNDVGTISISGGSITNSDIGIYAYDCDELFGQGGDTTFDVSDVSLVDVTTGILVEDNLFLDASAPDGIAIPDINPENSACSNALGTDSTPASQSSSAITVNASNIVTTNVVQSVLVRTRNEVSQQATPTLNLSDSVLTPANGAAWNAEVVGGSASASALLRLNNTTLDGNGNSSMGGISIDSSGILETLNGTEVINHAGGPGIQNAGTATIYDTLLNNNSGATNGGGINNTGTLTLANSTISGNTATTNGGGVWNNGTATVTNNTITGNTATSGGGVFGNAAMTLQNTIVSGNTGNECAGTITADANNLFGFGDTSVNTPGGCPTGNANDLYPVEPLAQIIAGLANNGGNAPTHALVMSSPAIDGGDNTLIPDDLLDINDNANTTEDIPFDARGDGFFRLFDGDGDLTNTVDIGAYEAQPVCTLSTPTGVTEASTTPFNIELDCAAIMPNGVYGLDAGLSIPSPSDLLIAENTATTPTWSSTAADSFETLAGSVIGGQPPVNNLGLYAISRSGAASGLTTAFEVGRVDFLAAAAITQNRLESDPEPEATVDCTLTLSDVNGSPINASCVNTTFEVEDTLFATLQGAFSVNSDGTVSDMRASLAVTGDDSSTFGGPFSASGSSIATFNSGILNITGITDAQSPVDAELNIDGHIDCLALDGFNLRDLPTVNDLTGSTTRDAGDADDDRLIGTLDRDTIAGQFGLNEGDTGFTQDADVNGDNTINVLDLVHVGRNFGTGTGTLTTCAGLSGDNTTD